MTVKYILNDKLVDIDRAFIHVHDLALLRGYGVFDFFRLEENVPLFMDDHLDRFYRSAEYLRLAPPLSKQELKEKVRKMISINQMEYSGVRIVLTGGESPNGYFIGKPTLFVIQESMTVPQKEMFKKGIKLLSLEYQRELPEVKSIHYLMGIYKLPEMEKAGAADLIYHFNGKVSESTRSNFFIVDKGGKIITANEGVLKGINRKNLIELCCDKYPVEERPLLWDEVKKAREAFLTGTSKKVTPVVQIDDWVIGNGKPGKTTLELQRLYDDYIKQYIQSHR